MEWHKFEKSKASKSECVGRVYIKWKSCLWQWRLLKPTLVLWLRYFDKLSFLNLDVAMQGMLLKLYIFIDSQGSIYSLILRVSLIGGLGSTPSPAELIHTLSLRLGLISTFLNMFEQTLIASLEFLPIAKNRFFTFFFV